VRSLLVDTGPLYALADPDDQYHRRAAEQLRQSTEMGWKLALAFPVLLEAHTLVLRRLGLPFAHRWLDQVLAGTGLLNAGREEYLRARERLRKYLDQPITLVDAVVATLAEQLDLPVWTFDHHFDLMGCSVWRGQAG
jgi:predicted nucleic acid-binding protein